MRRLLALLIVALAMTACTDPVRLREDYMGKAWLQPEKMPQQVKRDAYGRPIVERTRSALPPSAPSTGWFSDFPDPVATIGRLFD